MKTAITSLDAASSATKNDLNLPEHVIKRLAELTAQLEYCMKTGSYSFMQYYAQRILELLALYNTVRFGP